ncbi:MAG: flavodoxin family protein [Lachnospiraceae bacterium]|jgi:multimeric flavodoxin WrbA|nr:flavodoxin family protein [Lachnospiraceae bacterium]MCI1327518.1 flavodoxin family protein [Lachnospiraceae bacterium]
MGKEILVLTGSARKKGNSDLLADAFIKGAEKAGHHITKICTADLSIGGCKGCDGCWKSGGNCIFNDDMRKLEPLLEKADVLVIATPMYWSMMPAQLKAPIDRLYQYDPVHGGRHLHIRESILLTCGETEEKEDFAMIKSCFRFISEYNGMKVRDVIAVPGVKEAGEILKKTELAQAEKLGHEI